jgi:hypothetical protein
LPTCPGTHSACALAAFAALLAACGGADEEPRTSQVLRLSVETANGVVVGVGRARVVLDLKPGTYTYLCSTGGYWRTQHGTLVVR